MSAAYTKVSCAFLKEHLNTMVSENISLCLSLSPDAITEVFLFSYITLLQIMCYKFFFLNVDSLKLKELTTSHWLWLFCYLFLLFCDLIPVRSRGPALGHFTASMDDTLENNSNNVVSNGTYIVLCIVIVWFSFIHSHIFSDRSILIFYIACLCSR